MIKASTLFRAQVLPILTRHERVAVLKARAQTLTSKIEQSRAKLPAAMAAAADAKAALDETEQCYKTAKEALFILLNGLSGAETNRQILLEDAHALAQGQAD
jgi:hypothetical protein